MTLINGNPNLTHDAIYALRQICEFLLDDFYVDLRYEQLSESEFAGWNSYRIETIRFISKIFKDNTELARAFDEICKDDESVPEPIDNLDK